MQSSRLPAARRCPACDHDRAQWAFVVMGFPCVRCEACGTLFVSPLPSPDVVQATYLRPDYHETAEDAAVRMRAEADARVRVVEGLGARRIIEVGCGPGHFLDAARDRGLTIEGVDPARTAAAARARGHVVHALWLEQYVPTAPFDALALWEVLEHLPAPAEALATMVRWLRPDGIVALSTPSLSGIAARVMGRNFPMITPPDHLEIFTRQGLARLLARAGLQSVRWTSFSNLDAPALTRALRRRGLGGSPLAGLLGRLGAVPASWIDRAGLGTSFEVYARRR
ncbi:MAG: class I SAM-dependent methyltransferase [Nannocystaceae bacterium]